MSKKKKRRLPNFWRTWNRFGGGELGLWRYRLFVALEILKRRRKRHAANNRSQRLQRIRKALLVACHRCDATVNVVCRDAFGDKPGYAHGVRQRAWNDLPSEVKAEKRKVTKK